MSIMACINPVLLREALAHPVPFRGSIYADKHRSEDAYITAVTQLFKSLDRLESALSESSTPYLLSSPTITEADVRLYTTIIRFDPVYVQHFKCNIRDIRSGYVNTL
jgi:glutathionyl-hydroquinone reductase